MTKHIKNAASSRTRGIGLSMALALGAGSLAGCLDSPEVESPDDTALAQSELALASCDNPNPALFAPAARPYGRSMISWAENWWRWGLGIPLSQNPNDTPNVPADINQKGPVFFLPTPPPGASTDFTVPRHKAIAVLLSSLINDYPCPDPTFEPAPGQSLFDFLLEGAVQGDNVAEISGTLDGVVLEDLARYYVTSKKLMYFTGDLSLQALDPCITGSPQPAAIEAHFMIVKPLAPGTHVLTTHIVTTAGAVRERTATVTVPGH
jgi:hypothetical protein